MGRLDYSERIAAAMNTINGGYLRSTHAALIAAVLLSGTLQTPINAGGDGPPPTPAGTPPPTPSPYPTPMPIPNMLSIGLARALEFPVMVAGQPTNRKTLVAVTKLAGEGSGPCWVTVSTVAGGTATQSSQLGDGDYKSASTTLSWDDGELGVKYLSVEIVHDTIDEFEQTIKLQLTNNNVAGPSSAFITIIDDDDPPQLRFAASSGSEKVVDRTLTFWLSDFSEKPINATLEVTGGTAVSGSDYQLLSNSLSITPYGGFSSATIRIVNDAVEEPDETIEFTVVDAVNCTPAESPLVFTIRNDDFTDPNGDADGDGMPYGYELQFGLNPYRDDATLDIDGDGQSNHQEYKVFIASGLPLDPLTRDSNADRLRDSVAYLLQSAGSPGGWLSLVNNIAEDADGDGLTNTVEFEIGTAPHLRDTDGDGHDDNADAFPRDPLRWQQPSPDPNDHTPPVITLIEPRP